jgi:hypothetical protein
MRQDVIAAVNLSALADLGPSTTVRGFPQARLIGSALFFEISSLAAISLESLWRNAFPGASLRTGQNIGPLVDPGLARQLGLNWVGLGPGGTVPIRAGARFDGKYYVTGVSHKYSHDSGGSGGYQTQFRVKRP